MAIATKRKGSLERLTVDKYFNLIEHAADGIAILQDGVFKLVNTALARISGYDKEELRGMPFTKLLTPESQKLTMARYQARLAGKKVPPIYEIKAVTKDREVRDIEVNATPTEYEGRVADEVIIRDITERKRAEEALADEATRRRILVDQSRDGIVILDNNGKVYEANQRFAEMLGYSPEEAAQLHVWDWDTQWTREQILKMIHSVDAAGDHFETYHRRKDGTTIDVEISTNGAVCAGQKLVFCVCRDITERKKKEELQHGENYVLTLLGQGAELSELLDAIVRLGEDNDPSIKGSVLLLDPSKSKELLFQASAPSLPNDYKELIANGVPTGPKAGSCGTAAHRKERVIVPDIAKSPLFKPFEEVVKRAVNNNLLAVWSQPIIASNGDLLGTIANYSNKVGKPSAENLRVLEWSARIAAIAIERKRLEQEREQLLRNLEDKTKELEQIIYVTSHDLRSPLVNIQGFTRELEQSLKEVRSATQGGDIPPTVAEKLDVPMDEDIPTALKYILASTSKIDLLLSGLLRLSRLGRAALAVKNLDMNKLMADVIHAFEFNIKEAEVTLEVEGLPSCRGDNTQINQVFSNLIDNALKFLDPSRPGIIRVSGRKEDGQVIFCVEDNGIGIAPEHHEKVFEIFQRFDPGASSGEGLGLTIVRRILDRHSGKIWLESESGKGSKFFVSLPAA